MFKITLVSCALMLLAGCAEDHYVANSGTDPGQMQTSLDSCKSEALAAYDKDWLAHHNDTGAIVAGVMGGAVGGALAGIVSGSENPGGMQASDIDPAIERCMARKGYIGTSRN